MPFIGWILSGVAFLLLWGAITGNNPLTALSDVFRTGKVQKSNDWHAITTDSGSQDSGSGASSGTASGVRQKVLSFAQQQIGDSYVWGATGPNTWDCSGLTQAAYKSVGVNIPRVSGAQAKGGQNTTTPQIGDVVWFGAPVHHVGIYAGNNTIVHAPEPGKTVTVAQIWTYEPHGFRNYLGDIVNAGAALGAGANASVSSDPSADIARLLAGAGYG